MVMTNSVTRWSIGIVAVEYALPQHSRSTSQYSIVAVIATNVVTVYMRWDMSHCGSRNFVAFHYYFSC